VNRRKAKIHVIYSALLIVSLNKDNDDKRIVD
jgi:uncharacterized protein Veg